MSNFIKDGFSERVRNKKRSIISPESDVHLNVCQTLAKSAAFSHFDLFLTDLYQAYETLIFNSKSNQETVSLLTIQREIKNRSEEFKMLFIEEYLSLFDVFRVGKLNTNIESSQLGLNDAFSLVDNQDLDQNLILKDIINNVITEYKEPLWFLTKRFGVLCENEALQDASNPLSPAQYCFAFREALKRLEFPHRTQIQAYNLFGKYVLDMVRSAGEPVNDYLISKGILPYLKYREGEVTKTQDMLSRNRIKYSGEPKRTSDSEHSVSPKENVSRRNGRRASDAEYSTVSVVKNTQSEALAIPIPHQELLSSIKSLQVQLAQTSFVQVDRSASGEIKVAEPTYISDIRHSVQSQLNMLAVPLLEGARTASSALEVDKAIVSRLQSIPSVQDEHYNQKKKDSALTKQLVDFVWMVFDFIFKDEGIPDAVKSLLSFLQAPFLKAVIADPEFLQAEEHPAQLLLNVLSEAGSTWVSNDGSSQFNIYEKIKNVVEVVVAKLEHDPTVIQGQLDIFQGYIAKVKKRQVLTEKRIAEQAEGKNKVYEMKAKVHETLQSLIKSKALPKDIVVLLLKPWADYLTFILLRSGEASEEWASGISTVNDVLWSVEVNKTNEELEQLRDKLEPLASELRRGMTLIGLEKGLVDDHIFALTNVCQKIIADKYIEPAEKNDRDALERESAEKAGQTELLVNEMSEVEADLVEKLKVIEYGTWFELKNGKRLKVAWFNSRASRYMLVDQGGKPYEMMMGLKLSQLLIAGEAKMISGAARPLFDRAMDNIYQKLSMQASKLAS